MSNLHNLTIGDPVAVVTSGRRYSWVADATVTRLTPKRIYALIDGANGAIAFNLTDGYAIERHRNDRLITRDDPTYDNLKMAQKMRNEAERAVADAERAEREARFPVLLALRDDKALLKVLDSLASDAVALDRKITARLSRVTPKNLYQELVWLQQSAADSALLAWWLALLNAAEGRVSEGTVVQLLTEHCEHARGKLLAPYSNLENIDSRAELLAAREVHEKLSGHLKYTLEGRPDAEVNAAVLNAVTGN